MSDPVRVLIVDDSPVASALLRSILEADAEIRVVGVARDGIEAVELVPRLKPDLITMDVWMPRLDGFAAVEQVMAYHPTPILVITASLARSDVDIGLTMLAAGALDVIEKPARTDDASWARACKALTQKVKVLAQVRVVTHLRGRRLGTPGAAPASRVDPTPTVDLATPTIDLQVDAAPKPRPAPVLRPPRRRGGTGPLSQPPPHPPRPRGRPYQLVTIASSTGGPQALLKTLRGLPREFDTPILIVQHIAEGFTRGLADWLGREAARHVRLAVAGESPAAGSVLLAPDGHQMTLGPDGRILLVEGSSREICPSADVTMRSVAGTLGAEAIGVILTGMGRDGAEGLRAMRLAGAYTIAQDEGTSIIFGMPRAAIALGIIDEVLPLDAIPGRLAGLVKG